MFRNFLPKLVDRFPHEGQRPDRVSILLPFLIIAAGMGVLAWHSYQLSVRIQRGANTLAIQYASYAGEITARRADAAIRTELARASDEWQQVERRTNAPDFAMFQQWINEYPWIVSAIYVPDADPAGSIYVSEVQAKGEEAHALTREFYTASGTVRYMYDPRRLLVHVKSTIGQQPLTRTPADALQSPPVSLAVIATPKATGLAALSDGYAFVSPLAPPMSAFSIRATVPISYIGAGVQNQRVISLVLAFVALALTGLGAFLTLRGLNKEAETMNLRAALIANVSHELRTPLSMIRLGAETLRRGAAKLTADERVQLEEQILREVLHLSHMVENVLDVARMQHRNTKALALIPVYPRDLIVSLVSTYDSWIRSKGFALELQIDETVGEQMWDRDAISRAVLNLIDNAIKYSRDEKIIRVVLRQTAQDVVIEVNDRGLGIEAKDVARIFDPYFRAQFSDTQTRRGAGLGLTLVQQIVTAHGGRVEVESERGIGSTFRLLFPRAVGAESTAPGLARVPEPF